jgi:hypothetical protein
MSDVIRAVRGGWTPPPRTNSFDVRADIPRDTYSFLQNQIESQQRQAQSGVNRTIRSGNLNSFPRAETASPIRMPVLLPTTIITLPVP